MDDGQRTRQNLLDEIEELRREDQAFRAASADLSPAAPNVRGEDIQFYRLLIEATETGFVILDGEGRVLDANAEYVRLTGRGTLDALLGKSVLDWTAARDHAKNAAEVKRCLELGSVRNLELSYVAADGRETPIEVHATVVKRHGEPCILSLCHDISSRRRMELELREQNAFIHSVVQRAAEGLCVAHTTAEFPHIAFTIWNQRMCEITGYSMDEINRLGWYQSLYPDPELRARVMDRMSRLPVGDDIQGEEWEITRADGKKRVLSISSTILPSEDGRAHVLGLMYDITERKRAEAALAESEKKYRAIFEGAAEGILITSMEGRFCYANPAACGMLGYTYEELCVLGVDDVHPKEELPRIIAAFETQARGGKPIPASLLFRRKDGTVFPADIVSSGIVLDGIPCSMGFFIDVTERRRAEEERLRLESHLLHAQKLESLGILAGGIAHDFNNILTAILGNTDLAKYNSSPSSPTRPMLEEISKATLHAADLCKQLLAYSGKGRFAMKAIDLNELLGEMRSMLDMSVARKTAVSYLLADRLPAVEADASQIRQVVMNLVINAAEATGGQDGRITVSSGSMECDAGYLGAIRFAGDLPPGRYSYVEVSDNGCGMDAATIDRIFDPFFTTKFTGRGLGLAAVLGIVRGHKGALRVYSEPGKGTTFKVLLPAVATAAETIAPESARSTNWKGSGLILLADDEAAVRKVGRLMLENLGFSVLTAEDGNQALAVFRENAAQIRCVILDLTMPGMGGEEAFRELRRIRPDVRIIMSSGYNEQEVVNRFVGRGLAGFIQKPYEMDSLASVLRHTLGPDR